MLCVSIGKERNEKMMKAVIGTFLALFTASAKKQDLCRGSKLHADLLKKGLLQASSLVADALVVMYAKCGVLAKAEELINELSIESVVPWTALIAGYVKQGCARNALACYERFQQKGVPADAVMFTCILKACGSIGAIDKGKQIHEDIAKSLLGKDVVLGTTLVDMYAKCGALLKAKQVLDELHVRDVISWSALIAGYAHQGQGHNALDCFERMQCEGLSPNAVTLTCILKVCSTLKDVFRGEQIHIEITKQGWLGNDVMLGNALVEMYAKCGDLIQAKRVLEELPVRNVVSWTALITGYLEQGQCVQALRCFKHMQHEGLSPDAMTFICMLKACGSLGAADQGEQIHDLIARQGLLEGNLELATALVNMYVKCDAFNKAQEVLEELQVRDAILWNALIAGYAQQGLGTDALTCFEQMQREGVSPDVVTFTCILTACGSIGAVDKGQEIHDEIARLGLLEDNMALGSALVDMYAKCGALTKAQTLLEELPIGDCVSWSALIVGHALQGDGEEAFKCFERMQSKGVAPDSITFSCVLNACCHSGLVHEGEVFFSQISSKFGIKLNLEHYICMVALLGNAGCLDKAVAKLQDLPSSHYPAVCATLLGVCRKWGDVNIGKWAFEYAIQLDKYDAAPYVCMANLYADAGRHEDAEAVEAMLIKIAR